MMIINSNIISITENGNVDTPIKLGSEATSPTKLHVPERATTTDKPRILPITNSLRLIGVNTILARVPLSFSPAIDSGQNDRTVEYNNETVTIGKMNDKICPIIAFLVPTSATIAVLVP